VTGLLRIRIHKENHDKGVVDMSSYSSEDSFSSEPKRFSRRSRKQSNSRFKDYVDVAELPSSDSFVDDANDIQDDYYEDNATAYIDDDEYDYIETPRRTAVVPSVKVKLNLKRGTAQADMELVPKSDGTKNHRSKRSKTERRVRERLLKEKRLDRKVKEIVAKLLAGGGEEKVDESDAKHKTYIVTPASETNNYVRERRTVHGTTIHVPSHYKQPDWWKQPPIVVPKPKTKMACSVCKQHQHVNYKTRDNIPFCSVECFQSMQQQ